MDVCVYIYIYMYICHMHYICIYIHIMPGSCRGATAGPSASRADTRSRLVLIIDEYATINYRLVLCIGCYRLLSIVIDSRLVFIIDCYY